MRYACIRALCGARAAGVRARAETSARMQKQCARPLCAFFTAAASGKNAPVDSSKAPRSVFRGFGRQVILFAFCGKNRHVGESRAKSAACCLRQTVPSVVRYTVKGARLHTVPPARKGRTACIRSFRRRTASVIPCRAVSERTRLLCAERARRCSSPAFRPIPSAYPVFRFGSRFFRFEFRFASLSLYNRNKSCFYLRELSFYRLLSIHIAVLLYKKQLRRRRYGFCNLTKS